MLFSRGGGSRQCGDDGDEKVEFKTRESSDVGRGRSSGGMRKEGENDGADKRKT